jgi:hypothetical protein
VCLTYKYVVHAERHHVIADPSFSGGGRMGSLNGPTLHRPPARRRSLSFFQHGIDYVVFLPLMYVPFSLASPIAASH